MFRKTVRDNGKTAKELLNEIKIDCEDKALTNNKNWMNTSKNELDNLFHQFTLSFFDFFWVYEIGL